MITGKVVYIVGVGRSGTSLLQSMLNAHSKMVSLPETQFFRKYVANRKKREAIERKGAAGFKSILLNDPVIARLKIDIEDLRTLHSGNLDIIEVYQEILSIFKSRKNTEIVVDKDPRNIDFIPCMTAIFETPKIIHIVRDPRDVVLSKTKAKWSAGRPYWLHAMIGEAQLNFCHKNTRNLTTDNLLRVCYEELLADPSEILTKISSFIGVQFESSMLDFQDSAKALVSKEELQWKSETIGPLLRNNSNKWSKEFTSRQIRLIEKVSKFSMKHFNYVPWQDANKGIDKLWQPLNFIKVVSYFFNLLYELKVKKQCR
ncbi:MAG: sulfotransferase [Allomuricauda sp.]